MGVPLTCKLNATKGLGSVTLESGNAARLALLRWDGAQMDGCTLSVEFDERGKGFLRNAFHDFIFLKKNHG